MPTLLLIRHGDNDYLAKNRLPGHLPGIHLNKRGTAQASEICKSLKGMPIKAIYSSPLERALETANPLASALGLEIYIRPGLTDLDVGDWEGRSWKVLGRTKMWKVIQNNPSQFQFPGGESFSKAQERIVTALDAIASNHSDEMIAIVFHADPIKLAVAHYLGLPLDNFQKLTANTGSISILNFNGSNTKLIALNINPPVSFPKKQGRT
jgi:probable phosphomutase (TIGR03848 family)